MKIDTLAETAIMKNATTKRTVNAVAKNADVMTHHARSAIVPAIAMIAAVLNQIIHAVNNQKNVKTSKNGVPSEE